MGLMTPILDLKTGKTSSKTATLDLLSDNLSPKPRILSLKSENLSPKNDFLSPKNHFSGLIMVNKKDKNPIGVSYQ